MSEDPAHLLQVTAICHAGGEFLPLPAPRCRLEFIGDSITSGEGAIGAVCETDWISTFFSAENHYGRMTADALGAEYRVVSASGWGLVSGWDNDPRCTLAPCYTQVCGLAAGERNAALGARSPTICRLARRCGHLNLGTNDWNAFHNPPWVDPETGRSFKQTLADDGQLCPCRCCPAGGGCAKLFGVGTQAQPPRCHRVGLRDAGQRSAAAAAGRAGPIPHRQR